jgi:uncharacterized protein YcbK (DUF882 family)
MLEKETLSATRSNDIMPFIGVVENTSDPLQIGRVQVRAISIHPEQNDGAVPTADLPWAYVMMPTTSAGTSGIGSTHGLIDGSWVFGWFMDGRDAQQPFVVGTFVGAPGMTSLQSTYVDAKLSVASAAPGGLGGAFQTMLASAAGGLGPAGKFGSSIGSLLGLGNLLKNDDAVKTLTSMAGIGSSNAQTIPPLAAVMDKITSSKRLGTLLSGTAVAGPTTGLGAAAIGQLSDTIGGILQAGGASGFSSGSSNPLSSSALGTTARAGEEVTGENLTVAAQVDYDLLAASAPSTTGMMTVHSSGTPKHARFSLEPSLREGKSGYHLAIDQTGQILKLKEMSSQGQHSPGMDSVTAGGQAMGNIGILLVGGYPTSGDPRSAGLSARFFSVQLEVLDKLVDAFIKKFPKMVIAGGNEIGQTSSPGFNASDWASIKYPNNVNTTRGGEKKINGLSSSTVGAATKGAVPVTGSSAGTADEPIASEPGVLTGNKKGFMGGPPHPLPSYAAKKQSDVPAFSRVNALTTGRGTSSSGAGSGGPEQQYLAKIEDPSMYAFKEARRADTLNARAQHTQWQVPKYPHGGEYGQAHTVRSTEGGHHILLDDTSGRQKVEIMSASGSMIQIHADGSGIFYMKGDTYDLTIGKRKVGINGDYDLTVGGNMKVSVQGDLQYDVTGKILFNGASDMVELIRGNRNTITEGSHLFQAKKNATHRVAKDMDFQVGGKKSERVRGDSHDSIDGNMARTIRGEDNSYVQGNKSSLVMGTQSSHAAQMINQSQNEMLSVAGGNFIASAKGKATMAGEGDVIMSTSGSFQIKGSGVKIESTAALDIRSAGVMKVGPASTLHLYSSGTIYTTTPMTNGAEAAGSASSATPAIVEAPPAQLTRESNPASSDSNLNAEQVTQGSGDAAEGESTEQPTGQSSSSTPAASTPPGSQSAFQEVGATGIASPSTLGNRKGRACEIANKIVQRGWSKEGAASMTGHMIQESSLAPTAFNPNDVGQPAGGLMAWRGSRLVGLKNFALQRGQDVNSVDLQLDYMDYEARNTHKGMGGAGLIAGGDIAQQIKDGANFERFRLWQNEYVGGEWHNRAGDALAVYNECFGNDVKSVGGIAPSNIEAYKGGSADNGGGGGGGGGWGGTPSGDDYSTGTGTSIAPAKGINPPAATIHSTAGGIDYSMKLSPNFTLGQLTPTSKFRAGPNETGRGTISSDEIVRNLSGCAMNVLEPILAHFGNVYVNSGYRSKAYNRQCGGAQNSDHMVGQATDIMVTGATPRQVADWIERNLPNIAGLGRYRGFTHISFKLSGNGGYIRKWGRN